MRLTDILLYGFVALGAAVLAICGFCAADWGYAIATMLVCVFWAWILYRKTRRPEDADE